MAGLGAKPGNMQCSFTKMECQWETWPEGYTQSKMTFLFQVVIGVSVSKHWGGRGSLNSKILKLWEREGKIIRARPQRRWEECFSTEFMFSVNVFWLFFSEFKLVYLYYKLLKNKIHNCFILSHNSHRSVTVSTHAHWGHNVIFCN